MARYVKKSNPVRDNFPGILMGAAAALLVALVIWAAPKVGPAVRDFLSDPDARPPVEDAAPEQEGPSEGSAEEEVPEEDGAEAQKLGDRLLAACKKFWPVLPVFIVVMEAVEYVGKFFKWIKNLF